MSEFSQAKSNSVESDYANRNEIRRIDNSSDKGFSTEFDKLNESLYKINSFLKLSKDIEDMKKENLVKNDIQRKLSLKSQWLSSNHGSTASLNSLPPTNLKANGSGHGSTQSLNKDATKRENELKKKRKNFANFKSQSVQNVNVDNDNKRTRRLGKRSTGTSYDELNFLDKLKLSDEDVSRLSQERDFQDKNDGFSKVDVLKRLRSQSESLGSSVSSSQRDLSKYFPRKEIKSKPINVNKNQKELKDVDLSKYFLPSPVQELKSLPSPGQSPKLPRKPLNSKPKEETNSTTTTLLRTAIDNLQKIKKGESDDFDDEPNFLRTAKDNLQKVEPKKEDFTLRDQQLDGDVSLKMPPRFNKLNDEYAKSETPYSGYESIPLTGGKDDCAKLFDGMKSPVDDIDELFDKVAADVCSEVPKRRVIEKVPLKNQSPKIIRKFPEKKPIEIKKIALKSNFASPSKWFRKDTFKKDDSSKREAEILSKLSSNLLNEIKLLEEHLQLNDENQKKEKEQEEKKVKKTKKAKKSDKLEAEFLGTEEELNNAIDDILNQVAYKEDVPLNKPKKITQITLPKASQGSKSVINPFENAEAELNKDIEAPKRKAKQIKSAPKEIPSTSIQQNNTKSEDIVDFAFKPTVKESQFVPKAAEIKSVASIQRVPSTEEPVTFTIRKPSASNIEPLKMSIKQEQQMPKFEIIQATPTVEKDVVTFTIRRSPSRETSPVQAVTKPEPETVTVNFRARSKERDSNGSRKNSLIEVEKPNQSAGKQEDLARKNSLSHKNPSREEKLFSPRKNSIDENVHTKPPIHKKEPEIDQKDLVSFTIRKPTAEINRNDAQAVAKQKPELHKNDAVQRALSKDKELVKVRETSFNEVSKVQIPIYNHEPEIEKKHVAHRPPSREREYSSNRENVTARKDSMEENHHVVKHDPEMKMPEIDKRELMSFMINKPLTYEIKTAQQPIELAKANTDHVPKANARKSFFAELNEANQPERLVENRFDHNKQYADRSSIESNKIQNEAPVKPARRRKSSKSYETDEEQMSSRKHESSPASARKNSFSKKEELKVRSNDLSNINNDTSTNDARTNEIPELNNIARFLDAHKFNEDQVKVVELSDSETDKMPSNKFNSTDNKQFTEVEYRKHNGRFDPPEYQNKYENRLSGSGDYDNVPSTSRRGKLDRNMSRSFDAPCEVDREYRDYDNVSRRSEERPKISSLDRKKNVTDMLLERSKNLHHKKQEFINEKLVETNPYIKRMIEKETRFRPGYERSRISPLTSPSHYEYHQPYSNSISRPLPSSTTAASSHLSYNPRAPAPSSSGRGVLDMFRSPTSSNKDSCIIS